MKNKTTPKKQAQPETKTELPLSHVELAGNEPEQPSKCYSLDMGTLSMVFRDDTTEESWRAAGLEISAMTKASAFALGDWLIYGKEHFPDGFKTAARITGLSVQYLRNCSSVSERFPAGNRYPTLSLEHHRLLGVIPDAEAREALAKRAMAEKLSAAAIREEAQKHKTPPPPPAPLTDAQREAQYLIAETGHLENLKKALSFLRADFKIGESLDLWKSAVGDLFQEIADLSTRQEM